jgi:predicted GNAT superfamily acetyltransferase
MRNIKYLCFERELPEDWFPGVLDLHRQVFGTRISARDFRGRLERKRALVCVLAAIGGKVIGYKIGYERNSDEYFSWLGGVKEGHRRMGIATELMRLQHRKALELGYKRVITESGNEWRDMIILNLTNGFAIVGTCTNQQQALRVIMAKDL